MLTITQLIIYMFVQNKIKKKKKKREFSSDREQMFLKEI